MTLDDAKQLLAAGEAEAVKNGWEVAIAILDDGAGLIALHRMDGARPGNADTAIRKARTSALTQRSSKVWEDRVLNGRVTLMDMPPLAVQGGLPIIVNGETLGAIGVSGVTSEQDEQIGRAAAETVFPDVKYVRPGD